jgi:hypothetical protein
VVEKIFNVCCMLHNDMLSEMETRETTYRVGRGNPLPGDARERDSLCIKMIIQCVSSSTDG